MSNERSPNPLGGALDRLERALRPFAVTRLDPATVARLERALPELAAALDAARRAITVPTGPNPFELARDLAAQARKLRLIPRRLSASEWRLGALTLHTAGDQAELRYARVPVATGLDCDPTAILVAWRESMIALAARSLPPDELLPRLSRAYDALRGRRPAGERVPLVELAGRIKPRGYGRAQFCHDLARLRRERRLVHDGCRIDLGVATGPSAADPETTLWIEDETGGGHYYRYFRLVPLTRRTEAGDDAQDHHDDERADGAPGAKNSQPDGRERKAAGARRVPRQRRKRDVPRPARPRVHPGPHRSR